MSDPNPNPTPTPEPQAAPAPQPSPQPGASPAARVYSQAEVDALTAAAKQSGHDAGAAATRRAFESREAPRPSTNPQPQPAPQPTVPSPAPTTILDIARVVTFTTEAAKHGIPAKGIELLASRLDAEKPADVAAWVAQQAADFGWKPTAPNQLAAVQPAAGAPAPMPQPNPAPSPTPGGPPPAPSAGLLRAPVHKWSQAELDAYAAKNGGPASIFRLFTQDSAGIQWSFGRPK